MPECKTRETGRIEAYFLYAAETSGEHNAADERFQQTAQVRGVRRP